MTDITERLRLRTDPSQMLMSYPARPAPDMLCYEAAAKIERMRAALVKIMQKCPYARKDQWCACIDCNCIIARAALGGEGQMDNYSDLFSQHEPDPLLRELNGNVVWYWKPMNPSDKRVGCLSNAPFEAAERIKKLEAALRTIAAYDTDADGNWGFFRDEADEALKEKTDD